VLLFLAWFFVVGRYRKFRLFANAFLAVTPHFSIYRHYFFSLSPAIFGAPFRIFREKVLFA
jgi:hypothetical protein